MWGIYQNVLLRLRLMLYSFSIRTRHMKMLHLQTCIKRALGRIIYKEILALILRITFKFSKIFPSSRYRYNAISGAPIDLFKTTDEYRNGHR